jgi:hypothetical protein
VGARRQDLPCDVRSAETVRCFERFSRTCFAVPSRTAISHHPKPLGSQIRGRPHRPPLPGYADEIDDNPLDLNAFGKHGGARIKVQNAGRRSWPSQVITRCWPSRAANLHSAHLQIDAGNENSASGARSRWPQRRFSNFYSRIRGRADIKARRRRVLMHFVTSANGRCTYVRARGPTGNSNCNSYCTRQKSAFSVGRHDVDIGGLWFAIRKFSLRARSPDLVPRRSASVRPHIAVRT